MPDIKYFRLTFGGDLIAEILSEEKTTYTIKYPLAMEIDVDVEAGRQRIYLYPWIPEGVVRSNECKLPKSSVLVVADVQDDINKLYGGMCTELYTDKAPMTTEKASGEENVISFGDAVKKNTTKLIH